MARLRRAFHAIAKGQRPRARPAAGPAVTPGQPSRGPAACVTATHPPGLFSLFYRPPSEDHPTMNLTDQLTDYVHAAFTGLYLLTHEPDEAEREIAQHARQ